MLKTDFRELIEEDGKVVGVVAERDGQPLRIRALRGVILGSGGFEQNQALRDRYLPQPSTQAWSATPKGCNTGAALLAGQKLGAATDLLDWAWWAPTLQVTGEAQSRAVFAERAFPGALWSTAKAGASSTRQRLISNLSMPCIATTKPRAGKACRPG